jgi:hypothetical protein
MAECCMNHETCLGRIFALIFVEKEHLKGVNGCHIVVKTDHFTI